MSGTVKPGTVLFEMGGITRADAETALTLAGDKLPVKSAFIQKNACKHTERDRI